MPNDMREIDIHGAGEHWYLHLNGERIDRRFWTQGNAEAAALRLEARLDKEAVTDRPCICCGEIFASAHRFNRLCQRCTSLGWSY